MSLPTNFFIGRGGGGGGLYDFTSVTFETSNYGKNGPNLNSIKGTSTFHAADGTWYNDTAFLNTSTYTGIFRWTVPANGTYRITTVGATGTVENAFVQTKAFGALIRGDVSLTEGEYLYFLIGQTGQKTINNPSTPGGGGTFVVKGANPFVNPTPVMIAGGGGGNGSNNQDFFDHGGGGGVTTTSGGIPKLSDGTRRSGYAGSNGSGGRSGDSYGSGSGGGGGGGLLGDGTPKPGNGGYPGTAFINGGIGGNSRDSNSFGGFGGGGGNWESSGSGGAGGGYSGGGASNSSSTPSNSGGGGSYCTGSNQYLEAGYGWDNTSGIQIASTHGEPNGGKNGYISIAIQ